MNSLADKKKNPSIYAKHILNKNATRVYVKSKQLPTAAPPIYTHKRRDY